MGIRFIVLKKKYAEQTMWAGHRLQTCELLADQAPGWSLYGIH